MIKGITDAETKHIFHREPARKIPPDIQQAALRKSRMLNNAASLKDLRIPPANRLDKLTGDRLGRYSIRINDQWRICFEWRDAPDYKMSSNQDILDACRQRVSVIR